MVSAVSVYDYANVFIFLGVYVFLFLCIFQRCCASSDIKAVGGSNRQKDSPAV